MIPYDTDPTLHDHEPARALLDDGFSPPSDERATVPPPGPGGEVQDVAPLVAPQA